MKKKFLAILALAVMLALSMAPAAWATDLPKLSAPTDLQWGGSGDSAGVTSLMSWKFGETQQNEYIINVYRRNGSESELVKPSPSGYTYTGSGVPDRAHSPLFWAKDNLTSGTYYFTLAAKGDGINYADSDFVTSPDFVYVKHASSISASFSNLHWEAGNEPNACWDIANTSSGFSNRYQIQFWYAPTKADTPKQVAARTIFNPLTENKLALLQQYIQKNGVGYYYFKVRAMSDDINAYNHSEWSELSPAYNVTSVPEITVKPVASVSINPTKATLKKGETIKLVATITPEDATDKTVTWISSNESMATVKDGVVTGDKPGTVTITAKAGDKTATCVITVTANDDDNPGSDPEKPTTPGGNDKPGTDPEKPTTPGGDDVKPGAVPVTDLYFNVKNINLIVGEDKQIKANVYPANATNQKVTYSSSDKAVATVDANGNVKATGAGKATITATSEEGAYKATCTVKVIDSDVKITLDKKQLDMIVGKRNSNGMLINPRTIPVKAEISGNVENKQIKWTSDNYKVGSVDNSTSEAFAKGAGQATVTAALADYPGIKATLVINAVEDKNANFIYNISFDANSGVLKCADVIQVVQNKEFTMPTAERKGYKLQYWQNKDDASKTYAANNAYAFSADTDLKAVWQQDTSNKPSSGGSHSGGNRNPGGATTPAKPEQTTKPGTTTEKPGTTTKPSGTVTALNINNVFADVKNGEWYSEAVAYVYNKGMMNGTEKGFEPNASTTRAMLVTMLYRLAGEPATGAANFKDVAGGQWFSEAIAWAAANGVVNGYEDGKFGPNDAITREQLALILYRYAQANGLDVSAKGGLSNFSDGAKVSSWATEAMQWAVGAGIINGDAGALKPAGNATRAEVAMMIMRYLEK